MIVMSPFKLCWAFYLVPWAGAGEAGDQPAQKHRVEVNPQSLLLFLSKECCGG